MKYLLTRIKAWFKNRAEFETANVALPPVTDIDFRTALAQFVRNLLPTAARENE